MPPAPRSDLVRERRAAFGGVVREARRARGLSQEALAERSGLDRKSISRMETGAFSPRLDNVFNLAAALEIPVSELFEAIASTGSARTSSADNA